MLLSLLFFLALIRRDVEESIIIFPNSLLIAYITYLYRHNAACFLSYTLIILRGIKRRNNLSLYAYRHIYSHNLLACVFFAHPSLIGTFIKDKQLHNET